MTKPKEFIIDNRGCEDYIEEIESKLCEFGKYHVIEKSAADKLAEALIWCDEMLTARDEMNSKVHCAPVRLSPITERVKQALKEYRGCNEE